MIINFSQNTKTSHDRLQVIHNWMKECMDYYDLGEEAKKSIRNSFLTEDGSKFFMNWLRDHKKIKISYWKIEDHSSTQSGFEIEEDHNLTLALLK